MPTGPTESQIADRGSLADILRGRQRQLDTDAADWVMRAGISFLHEPVPALPDNVS